MANHYSFTIANAVAFQAGWFICLLAPLGWALAYTFVFAMLHFYLSKQRREDMFAVVIALILGFVHDTALLQADVLRYSSELQPLWLACLWFMLGMTLRHSLWIIYSRFWLASLLGAVAAALSYSAGVALSGVSWGYLGPVGALVIAALWLTVLPLHKAITDSLKVAAKA
ncbi:DUF2878 domain-containing protein [Gilvimarinus sp. DA14]|uniref:DUF2878 domain-containing protein n=1 Tax=Gilvimarinus sp. DA14 TaxID=2956798 RepID=UPI0020B6D037|nr:DUF2878 domain-containing protein [Gilvimarinus sp. DA14]UTF60702.1 DUF2878 domain-containing protein [Gilvimarinus sp. DA14]